MVGLTASKKSIPAWCGTSKAKKAPIKGVAKNPLTHAPNYFLNPPITKNQLMFIFFTCSTYVVNSLSLRGDGLVLEGGVVEDLPHYSYMVSPQKSSYDKHRCLRATHQTTHTYITQQHMLIISPNSNPTGKPKQRSNCEADHLFEGPVNKQRTQG